VRPLFLAAIAAALCTSGCGGLGGIIQFSSFEGDWDGTWDGTNDSGPASLDIDALGDISGTMHADIGDEDGAVTGTIQNNGSVTMSVNFPSEGIVNGSGTLVLSNGGATLSGVVTFNGDPVTFDLDGP
jgi:hypothetical protein